VLAKTLNPRTLDRKVFLDTLAGKPRGSAEIWYEPNDPEAKIFAQDLDRDLGHDGAGWQVEDPKPLSEVWDSNGYQYGEHMPMLDEERIEANVNSIEGVQITANKLFWEDAEGETAGGALSLAITRGTGAFMSGGVSITDPRLPDDHFVIVVGHHHIVLPVWKAPWQETVPQKPTIKNKKQTQ
jgi:hypothetical protein